MTIAFNNSTPLRPQGDDGSSDADWKFCATMLPKVSRTFALSIGALPAELRDAIRIAYLLCRALDTIEDDAVVDPAARERLYDVFDLLMTDDGADPAALERLSEQHALGIGTDDHTLCVEAGAVFRCYRALSAEQRTAIRPHVLEMSRGMREFTRRADRVGRLRLTDLDELERYCYFVAGTVGKLLTALFEQHIGYLPPHLLTPIRARAVSFGLALQLVNIVKDVAEDLPRGDCFLPEDLATVEGVRLDDILEPANRSAGMAIIARVCERARDHLKRAEQYTLLWPAEQGAEIRLFCTVPLVLALATLHEVEDGKDTLVPGKTPKITRSAVGNIFADARVAIQRNDTLRWMIGYYGSGAYLDSETLPALAKERVSTYPASGESIASTAPARARTSLPPPSEGLPSMPPPSFPPLASHSAPVEPLELRGKVLVTGAAAHLGANVVRGLLRAGHAVRVLLRQGGNNQALDGLAVERVYGDLLDRDAVAVALAGCESVMHTEIGHDEPSARVQAAHNVLALAYQLGIRRVVCTGSFDAECSTDGPNAQAQVLVERECLRAVAAGLDVVMVNPSSLVGPHDYELSTLGRALIQHAHGALVGDVAVESGFEITTADDVAQGHLLALTRGRTGQRYTLASRFVSKDELTTMFEDVTGVPSPRPQRFGRFMTVANRMSKLLPKRFTRATESPVTRRSPHRADTSLARNELAFAPTSVERALHDAYADFARRGLVSPRMTIVDVPETGDVGPSSGQRKTTSASKSAGAAA